MMKTVAALVIVVGISLLSLGDPSPGPEFDISRNSAGEGGGPAAGGDFRLTGTIGRGDAGTMRGGQFQLNGGFQVEDCVRIWECDGDVDGDGQVNPVDAGLVQAGFCLDEECTNDSLCQYDIDCDGQINPVDSGIVQSLFGTCDEPRAACR